MSARTKAAQELVLLARKLVASDNIFGDDAPAVDPAKVQKLKDETKSLQDKRQKLKNQTDWRKKSPVKMSDTVVEAGDFTKTRLDKASQKSDKLRSAAIQAMEMYANSIAEAALAADAAERAESKEASTLVVADDGLRSLAISLYKGVVGKAGTEVAKMIQEALKQAYELGSQGKTAKTAGPMKKLEVAIRRGKERGTFVAEFKVPESPGRSKTVRTETLSATMDGFGPGQSAWSKVKEQARQMAESMLEQYGCTEVDIH